MLQSFIASLAAVATFGYVSAAPTAVPHFVARHRSKATLTGLKLVDGDVRPNSYIVKLLDTADHDNHILWASSLVSNSSCTGATQATSFGTQFFNGYSAELDDDAVAKVLASDAVDWVEEDGIMRALGVETNAPWGLARISQSKPLPPGSDPAALDFTYTFADTAGEGVDVYVVDTGIRTTHTDFGGRATMVFSAPGLAKTDDNGHGSHCAGTVAGTRFGVAKDANVLGVKVLDADGAGATSDILAGLNFVVQAAKASRRPSVLSMSLGGAPSRALDNAVLAAVTNGVHVVVAAGNENQNAGNVSPARVPDVITVGASDIDDTRAFFSNFGAGVDIFAPGVSITSVGIASNTATETFDGTSMACPHVAGVVAAMLSQNPTLTPAQMQAQIQASAVDGVIRGLPRGTENRFAQLLIPSGAQGSTDGTSTSSDADSRDGSGVGGDDASSGVILGSSSTPVSPPQAGATGVTPPKRSSATIA